MKFRLIFLAIALGGCIAQPNFIDGKYYMTGDSACIRFETVGNNTIACYNSDGELQGHRKAMTAQQLQKHMHNETLNSQKATSYGYQPRSSPEVPQKDMNCYTLADGTTQCY